MWQRLERLVEVRATVGVRVRIRVKQWCSSCRACMAFPSTQSVRTHGGDAKGRGVRAHGNPICICECCERCKGAQKVGVGVEATIRILRECAHGSEDNGQRE